MDLVMKSLYFFIGILWFNVDDIIKEGKIFIVF